MQFYFKQYTIHNSLMKQMKHKCFINNNTCTFINNITHAQSQCTLYLIVKLHANKTHKCIFHTT